MLDDIYIMTYMYWIKVIIMRVYKVGVSTMQIHKNFV